MTVETHLTNLKINRLTYAQYQQAESQGLINPNEQYFITDKNVVFQGDNITSLTNNAGYQNSTQVNTAITSNIINDVTHTDTNKSLSAKMGKELQDQITNLKQRGRYLSIWNCTTGLATTEPTVNPYTYKAGDYFLVGVVGATNYKPNGATYDKDVPSTTVETGSVVVNDAYYYDGTSWSLLHTEQPTVAFSTLAGSPYDNTNLTTALNAKQNTLTAGTDISIVNNVVSFTGTIPTVNDATLTIQKNNTTINTFTANSSTNKTVNIEVPTAANDISYTNPDYPTVGAALDKLLYVMPSVTISGGGNYEMGATVSTVNLSWTWNKNISSQSLNQGIGSLATDVRSYSYTTPTTSNKTFTITGSDGTNTKSASTSITFYYKRYWGVSANTTLTDAEILALSQELSGNRTQTRTFDCSGGKYFYFVILTSYCTGISFKVGGLSFSDVNVVTRNVTNAQGYTASYNIYRPNNIQTGSAISVVVS